MYSMKKRSKKGGDGRRRKDSSRKERSWSFSRSVTVRRYRPPSVVAPFYSLFVHAVKLSSVETPGRAYDRGGASVVDERVTCYSGR